MLGGPGCYHRGAPTEPDVPALGHPVPRTNSFAILKVPKAIRPSDVDMQDEPQCVRHVSLDRFC